ncbi:metallophosphoesterase family protein [Flavobacterium sp. MMS24-S5]|uniref:metallophosphoesterase family protein n=1 Tax=Flavobacterium sp. MMS24-S5 TaxID=3416605 RepID=UPI003CFCB5C9
MKTLIFSDVHGNLPAFEKMLKTEADCEEFICLGDLVNYAPWSNECVDLAASLSNVTLLIGNHEEAFINGFYPGENSLVQRFFSQNFDDFMQFDAIKKYIKDCRVGNYICQHTIFDKYIYPDTEIILDNNYIIGHSHHQFKYENNNFTLYNSGSVGQNRKFINLINYLVYDNSNGRIEMKKLIYDVDLVINEMKIKKFPEECINYYLQKKRYNQNT